ncbi:MAG: methylase [Rhizorhabdus sp.]|nr:methylase [Rhizorhabdus sp.]
MLLSPMAARPGGTTALLEDIIMTMPLFRAVDDASDDDACRLLDVAQALARTFAEGKPVTRRRLTQEMTHGFGGTDAQGCWTMRQAYDALEAAQILLVRRGHFQAGSGQAAADMLGILQRFEQGLPTQSYRSERQIDLQQFSTPLTLAWLAARAARIVPSDVVLEPSAGTGMLAVHAQAAGARLSLNEYDPGRATLLARLFDMPVSGIDAEHVDNLLDLALTPTVVLINPPFSRSETRGRDRHAAARHLRSALLRLAEGGRCVAIMPRSFAEDGSGAAGYASACEIVRPCSEISILGQAYAKHGTGIDVRLLIFDKSGNGPTHRHVAKTVAEALPHIEALPDRGSPTGRLRPTPDVLPARPMTSLAPSLALRSRPRLAAPPHAVDRQPARLLCYMVRSEPRAAGTPIGLYVPWRLARIDIEGARPHPDQLVESIAMASVLPPAPAYTPLLHPATVEALSDAQLEAVVQAGEAFERDLPGLFKPNVAGDQLVEATDGRPYRTGFFIGDGTGVGKGREAAACIRDQWNRGHRKAIWISKSGALVEDARRDWVALGGVSLDIQPLDAFPAAEPIAMTSGILFLTYAGLRSARHDSASRLQQILAFAGTDFSGLVIFDEAHAMANAAGTETDFGAAKGSEQGLAGVRLQNALPRARILYVSATGATDPANLCYAARLGLWGPGSAFRTREVFLTAMQEGGIAAMEIVARDLKAMGLSPRGR